MAGAARPVGGWLLERGGELARIGQAVEALQSGTGGVLVIQGMAGIGKSSPLRVLCEHATEVGAQTCSAWTSELERDFGFGVVRQLLETRMVRATESERTGLLSGAAGLAGPVLGLDGGSVGNPFAALHGLYWRVANLSATGRWCCCPFCRVNQRLFRLLRLGHVVGHGRQQLPAARKSPDRYTGRWPES